MSMQANETQTTEGQAGKTPASKLPDPKATHRAVTDPREVASVVMARMNLVNAKKDELAIAIHGLVDITQQLTRTYAEQVRVIEELRARVKALEATASGPSNTPATVQ